jgi:hypothetical protein
VHPLFERARLVVGVQVLVTGWWVGRDRPDESGEFAGGRDDDLLMGLPRVAVLDQRRCERC